MYMLERHYDELTKGLEDRTQLQAVNITNAGAPVAAPNVRTLGYLHDGEAEIVTMAP